jgi:sorting nexin-1/2
MNLDDDDDLLAGPSGPRVPPPVQPPTGHSPQRQREPSMNIIEASKPTFHITVGDPHKVGDLTSAHTEYMVFTKVTRSGTFLVVCTARI